MWLLLHIDVTIYGILILLYMEYWYSVDIMGSHQIKLNSNYDYHHCDPAKIKSQQIKHKIKKLN